MLLYEAKFYMNVKKVTHKYGACHNVEKLSVWRYHYDLS